MTDVPKNMDCEEALEHLYDYLDGELTAEREAEVHTHLERCIVA